MRIEPKIIEALQAAVQTLSGTDTKQQQLIPKLLRTLATELDLTINPVQVGEWVPSPELLAQLERSKHDRESDRLIDILRQTSGRRSVARYLDRSLTTCYNQGMPIQNTKLSSQLRRVQTSITRIGSEKTGFFCRFASELGSWFLSPSLSPELLRVGSVGDGGGVLAYSETGQRRFAWAGHITGRDFDRGQHKRTSDGAVTPRDIEAWLSTPAGLEPKMFADPCQECHWWQLATPDYHRCEAGASPTLASDLGTCAKRQAK